MKRITAFAVLSGLCVMFGAARAAAVESGEGSPLESLDFMNRLLSLPGPGAPEIFEDTVIFTAPSSRRRVGIAFGHENFSRVYWFKRLMVPQDPLDAPIPKGKKVPDPYKDSGILFYVLQVPKEVDEVDYRLIIDGLWTTDPANQQVRRDPRSALTFSTVVMPRREKTPYPLSGPPGSLSFSFKGPRGEEVYVAGSFNGWDPFMYRLKEGPAGTYTLNLPLPPGKYQYVFYNRGRRVLDPYNFRRSYSVDGSAVNEIEIK